MARLKAATIKMLLGALDLDASAIREALLRHQYLPNIRENSQDLPPIFSTRDISDRCAADLATITNRKLQASPPVEFRTRRFDGLIRRMGIHHPVPYSKLIEHMASHWVDLGATLGNEQSRVQPFAYPDGRIIKVDYETSQESMASDIQRSHGMRFRVRADISSCFPSIYSHSIDWALRGKAAAKADRSARTWQGKLDRLVRNCHDTESKGLIIGPAVSNLLAEIVLQAVDQQLASHGFRFVRYIDDYTYYCRERSEAEQFIAHLQRSLASYRLDLNTRKTRIEDLSMGFNDAWIPELLTHLPSKWTPLSATRYLHYCERCAIQTSDKSVLKFAVKSLAGLRESSGKSTSILVVDELTRLCEFHPHLIALLSDEIEGLDALTIDINAERLGKILSEQMRRSSDRLETDVVLWHLYTIRKILGRQILKPVWGKLLDTDDDLVVVGVAALCPRAKRAAAKTVRGWTYASEDDRKRHWFSRYEFWRVGLLTNSDLSDLEKSWMKVLQRHNVALSLLTT